jgi:iron complex outermembrane receptor protein
MTTVRLPQIVLIVLCSLAGLRAATLTGNISNGATGNLLEGARVEIPALGVATFSDNTGRYVFADLPAGNHEIVVSYIGLDSARGTIALTAEQSLTRDFDLTTGIYKLEAFKVTGEREGGAAAITAERNSENLKNVAATDQFGNLPNLNAGEIAIRLPGIYGELDAGGNLSGFTVRGMTSGLNTVTMDGGMLTGQGGAGRSIFVNNVTGAMFDQIELVKGHTPDKGADSLGGTINFKSRSPLSMREKRRVTYTLTARIAPSFTQQIPIREDRRTHGLASLGYQEVFDAFGGSRNLGVSVSLFNSETALGWFTSQRDIQNVETGPAFLWDYRTGDVYNHRRQKNITTKTDYRLSPATKLSFLASYIDHSEVYRRQYDVRAFTNQVVFNPATNNVTAGIEPGYTDRVTTVRPVAASTIDVTMTGPNNFFNRLRRAAAEAEHNWGRWQIEYSAKYTQTHINIGNGEGGVLVNRLTGAGWILDRTQSDLFPRFIQNGGPDFTNPALYRPVAANALTNGNNTQLQEVTELRADVRYTVPVTFPLLAKTGFVWREQVIGATSASRRWNYTGTGPLPASPGILMMDEVKTGRRIPQWEASDFIRAREVIDPTIWREDLYFRETTKFTGFTDATETVSAAYAMAQGKLGQEGWRKRTGFLGGVRFEKTENDSTGWVRARTLSTAAQQTADPLGTAKRDYADNRRNTTGSYTKAFPSIHLNHDITANLKARASWSTSFGRPNFNQLTPGETPNATNANFEGRPTLTINNPSILPQTAKNWDTTLEYYFEPVGSLSIGWFHKSIRNLIVNNIESGTIGTGNDNGYNGEYPGWTVLTSGNAGDAVVQGWEVSYQQQFTFLPGLLKGLSGMINYTSLDTQRNVPVAGSLTTTTARSTGEIAGFVPRTGNASLSWRYRNFSTRILSNYATTFLTTFSAGTPHRNVYRVKRNLINVGFGYQIRPTLNLTLDIDNLNNVPQKRYRGTPDNVEYYNYPGTTITVGVNGRF